MDNSQFRNLINDENRKASDGPASGATPSTQLFKTPMLGSRARSSIPMTPRSIIGYNSSNDFARQVAEQKRLANGEPPTKKFRSSAAPKGTKLKQGYQDRTSLRRAIGDEESQDDKERRLLALEEMFKLQQIDEATFEKLKSAIGIGGDVSSTHLVKGLDWKLLERVKRGEDLNKTSQAEEEEEEEKEAQTVDLDEELDGVLKKEVVAAEKPAHEVPGGEDTAPEASSTQVLSRDEILRRLKASRAASCGPPPPVEPALGDRFKKVGSGSKAEKKRFMENVKGRRREVLLTTDKDGNVKRKVRWLDKEAKNEDPARADAVQQPLGMDVPAEIAAKQKDLLEQQQLQEDEDNDIFAGVGADYNPLAGLGDDSDDASGSDGEITTKKAKHDKKPIPNDSQSVTAKRNYFNVSETAEDESKMGPMPNDPTIMAALKKAAALRQSQGGEDQKEDPNRDILAENDDPERALRHKQFLEKLKQRDREDAGDLDMGFGESRFGDEEDEDGPVWDDPDGTVEKKDGGGGARKRGPKKRKGNKDSVSDVMNVIEGRKKGGS